MKIKCPFCNTVFNLNSQNIKLGNRLFKCANCKEKFQAPIYNRKREKPKHKAKEKPCPYCCELVPTQAIRCKYCGNFRKKAKLTITRIRDELAKDDLIRTFQFFENRKKFNWDSLLINLPINFQLDYSIALRLEVELRNKGISLIIEDGKEITATFEVTEDRKEITAATSEVIEDEKEIAAAFETLATTRKPKTNYSETVYPKITIENVLKAMDKESSIKKELFGKLYSQNKDLLIIVLIALIPFFSIKLDDSIQILFYPSFLGILWAFIVFSFFGDGKVPIKKTVVFFITSASIGTLTAFVVSSILSLIFSFLPKIIFYIVIVGCIEETAKLLPLFRLIKKPKKEMITLRYVDVLVLSLVCGIGFGACENILYKVRLDNLIGIAATYDIGLSGLTNMHFLRNISLPLLHGAWSAIFGVTTFHGFTIGKFKNYFCYGLIYSAVLHGTYNTLLGHMPSMILMVIISFSLMLMLYVFCKYIDKMKYAELAIHTKH